MRWDEIPNKPRSKGRYFDAELKLLRFLAENSTTSISQEKIYEYGDNLANVTALLDSGLIIKEKTISDGKEKIWYRISPNGYRFVKEEESLKRSKYIVWITTATLIVTVIALLFSVGILKISV